MNKYSFSIFVVLVLLSMSISAVDPSLNGKVQTLGCTIQSLPESTILDIQETYNNINSYSAEIDNKLGNSNYNADQRWQLTVQKPDKYRKTIIQINDQNINPPVTEICNGETFYTDETGTGSTTPYNCEALVAQTFGVIEKLNLFSSDIYESTAELDNNNVVVTINVVGDESETAIWVNPETYLIERVKTRTPQPDGSISERAETYRNIRLNVEFPQDEFEIPSS